MAAGAKFVYVKSNSFLETTRHDYGECLNKNRWNITEYTPQVYIALGRMFGKVLLSPGIRYEYTIRNINNRDQINETDNLYEYKNSSFYPYLTIKYTGKRVNAYLQYSRKVTQPDFNVLSGVAYIDTLTYSLGNPDLKATTENTIISGIDIGDFTFGIKYSHRKNPFENVEILKESEKNIVYATCVNFPKQEEFSASFSYGSAIGSFNYYGEVDLNLDKSYFDYGCNPATRSSFAVDAEANVSYQIKDFSIYANYTLQGRRTSLATTQKSVQNLNFGVSGRFLKKRLSINLELMDVMGKANYNNLAISYSHISNGTRGTSDMRGIRLRISYTIFNKPIRINGSRENEEILKRIK